MSEDPYIQHLFAKRIGGSRFGKDTAIYKFEKIKRAKLAAKAERPDTPIIDMGVGEPDEMAFPEIVQALKDEAQPGFRIHIVKSTDEAGDLLRATTLFKKE